MKLHHIFLTRNLFVNLKVYSSKTKTKQFLQKITSLPPMTEWAWPVIKLPQAINLITDEVDGLVPKKTSENRRPLTPLNFQEPRIRPHSKGNLDGGTVVKLMDEGVGVVSKNLKSFFFVCFLMSILFV